MTGVWQVKMGEAKRGHLCAIHDDGFGHGSFKNFIVPLQSFQVKKKKSQLCPLVAVQCVNLLLMQAALHFVFWKKTPLL